MKKAIRKILFLAVILSMQAGSMAAARHPVFGKS